MSFGQIINPRTFLEPSTITVSTLLSDIHYSIPDYQRDYSWTTEEVQQLWDDLVATAVRSFTGGFVIENPRPHFLGPIVLQKYPAAENRYPDVMDGQQRLVTIIILCSVLYEFADKISDTSLRENWRDSLKQILYRNIAGKKIPRIKIARDNDEFVELTCNKLLMGEREAFVNAKFPAGTKSKERFVSYRVWTCAELLHRNISKYLGNQAPAERDLALVNLLKTLLELTIVLRMEVLEQGVAYEVFETLNARGLDLQQADLIKNKLYSLAETQGTKNEVIKSWDRVVRSIQQQSWISLTEFLHFHFVACFSEAKQSELYNSVLRHLIKPGVRAKEYAEDAAKSAEAIQQILDAGSSFAPDVARDILSLKDFITNKYSLTLLIAASAKFAVTSSEMATTIKLAHHFVFRRFMIEGVGLSQYASEISSAARHLYSGQIKDTAALGMRLASLSQEKIFEAKFKEYIAPNHKIGFYVVEMIENHITSGAGTIVQRQSVNQHLEHIMPKRPNSGEWLHVASDPSYNDNVNRIGNLLVLEADINMHIKNKELAFKISNPAKRDYTSSAMTMPKKVSEYLSASGLWDFDAIVKRQKYIVEKYASQIWSL